MAQVTIRDLTVEYSSGGYLVRPLDGFSMDTNDGELVALLGPSGSGKTTLLSCIAGILRPTSGSIAVDDREVTGLQGRDLSEYRQRTVGVVFQAFNLIPGVSALDNVAVPLRLAGWSASAARTRSAELLDHVDLSHRLDHRPGKLSGGQQQRVAIARALALEPTVILADEPTAHLDHVQVEGVLRLLRDLAAPGRLVIVATHDDRMANLADRAIDMAPIATEAAGAGPVHLGAGEVLFHQGDRGGLIYEILSGEVEIVRIRDDRTEEPVRIQRAGEYFGELAPILGLPRSATARARGEVSLLALTVQDFRRRRPTLGMSAGDGAPAPASAPLAPAEQADEWDRRLGTLGRHLEAFEFVAGAQLFAEGEVSDCFYLIDEGEVRLEVHAVEIDSECVLSYAGPGELLGEVGVLAGTPRSASAYAESDVRVRRMTTATFDRLASSSPAEALDIARLLGRGAATKLLTSTERVAAQLALDAPDDVVDQMVAAAVSAQAAFEGWPEERVDALLKAIALEIAAHADELGKATVDETGLGDANDKAHKIKFGSAGVYASFAGEAGIGVLADVASRRIREVAAPVGVVFAMAPVTEPVSTYVNKVLICLKARNALILSPHRASQSVAAAADDVVQAVLAEHGAPPGLVRLVRHRTSRQRTARFMHHPDVRLILATGGAGMVEAAYSSGTPAIGVGTGNAPVWICSDADVAHVASCVVESKTFDLGLVCGAEQHLLVDRAVHQAVVDALEEAGTVVLRGDERDAFVAQAFTPDGHLRLEHIGQPAATIAAATGLTVSGEVRLIALDGQGVSPTGAYATERLAPIVTIYPVDGDEDAIALSRQLLDVQGAGHTAVIHSDDEDRIDRYARAVPVSRLLVRVPAAQGCGGVLTGLLPSMTLGCGTWGGTATTDNVGYRNLLNVKRVASMQLDNLLRTKRLTPLSGGRT